MPDSLSALWRTACDCVRHGELLEAHRLMLMAASAARDRPPEELTALALRLQTTLVVLAQAFADAAFDIPQMRGDELADALMSGSTARLAEAFEQSLHKLFRAAADKRFSLPVAQRIKAYIQANFQRRGTINDVARALGLSAGYAAEVFRKQYGVTPTAYLLDLRLAGCGKTTPEGVFELRHREWAA